jgi:hypothetical protein
MQGHWETDPFAREACFRKSPPNQQVRSCCDIRRERTRTPREGAWRLLRHDRVALGGAADAICWYVAYPAHSLRQGFSHRLSSTMAVFVICASIPPLDFISAKRRMASHTIPVRNIVDYA